MISLPSLRSLFQRAPSPGARKAPPMPDPTPQPPGPQSAPDVSAHLTALADAMRQLAESQKALIESAKPASAPAPALDDITGDPSGGVSPGALGAIDYSKLSPLQQITLGLRDSRPGASPRTGAD